MTVRCRTAIPTLCCSVARLVLQPASEQSLDLYTSISNGCCADIMQSATNTHELVDGECSCICKKHCAWKPRKPTCTSTIFQFVKVSEIHLASLVTCPSTQHAQLWWSRCHLRILKSRDSLEQESLSLLYLYVWTCAYTLFMRGL